MILIRNNQGWVAGALGGARAAPLPNVWLPALQFQLHSLVQLFSSSSAFVFGSQEPGSGSKNCQINGGMRNWSCKSSFAPKFSVSCSLAPAPLPGPALWLRLHSLFLGARERLQKLPALHPWK